MTSQFVLGMCELVMVGEAKQVKDNFFNKEPFPDPDESDEEEEDDAGKPQQSKPPKIFT